MLLTNWLIATGAGWCQRWPRTYRYPGPRTPRPGRTWWRPSRPRSSACWAAEAKTVVMRAPSVGSQTSRSSGASSHPGETPPLRVTHRRAAGAPFSLPAGSRTTSSPWRGRRITWSSSTASSNSSRGYPCSFAAAAYGRLVCDRSHRCCSVFFFF